MSLLGEVKGHIRSVEGWLFAAIPSGGIIQIGPNNSCGCIYDLLAARDDS